jgi:hypothetical protein
MEKRYIVAARDDHEDGDDGAGQEYAAPPSGADAAPVSHY